MVAIDHDQLIAMLDRLKLTAIRDQLDSLANQIPALFGARWPRRQRGPGCHPCLAGSEKRSGGR